MKKNGFSFILQILLALAFGLVAGLVANRYHFQDLVYCWLLPFGDLFLRGLQCLALPVVIFSILSSFASLSDLSGFGRLARHTVAAYLLTTVGAVSLGLVLANLLQPGAWISAAGREQLLASAAVQGLAGDGASPLQFLVDMVPKPAKINMLSVIVLTIIFSLAMVHSGIETRTRLGALFGAFNEVTMKVIDYLIRYLTLLGVAALVARIALQASSAELAVSLLGYALTVLLGLALLVMVVYPVMVSRLTSIRPRSFMEAMLPAQLLAVSTSSSAATLPVTLERVQQALGVRPEVAGFVLPLGATINMDGTCIYQGIAALFIAQAFGMDLSLADQLIIVATATLASIGAAAVPGAGVVMLTIVMEGVGIPLEGLALILALDRPLDMLRTAVNVTGDAAVAAVVNRWV